MSAGFLNPGVGLGALGANTTAVDPTGELLAQQKLAKLLAAAGKGSYSDTSPKQHVMQAIAQMADGAFTGMAETRQAAQQQALQKLMQAETVKLLASGGAGAQAALAAAGSSPTAGASAGVQLPGKLSLDDNNTDLAVRTVLAEAGSQGDVGRKAVAAVLRNRALLSGKSVGEEALAPNQFEPWNPGSKNDPRRFRVDSPEYQRTLAEIKPVLEGAEADPTGGATHFYAPGLQSDLGRNKPSWDKGNGTDIGGHRFFRIPYAGKDPSELAKQVIASTPDPKAPAKGATAAAEVEDPETTGSIGDQAALDPAKAGDLRAQLQAAFDAKRGGTGGPDTAFTGLAGDDADGFKAASALRPDGSGAPPIDAVPQLAARATPVPPARPGELGGERDVPLPPARPDELGGSELRQQLQAALKAQNDTLAQAPDLFGAMPDAAQPGMLPSLGGRKPAPVAGFDWNSGATPATAGAPKFAGLEAGAGDPNGVRAPSAAPLQAAPQEAPVDPLAGPGETPELRAQLVAAMQAQKAKAGALTSSAPIGGEPQAIAPAGDRPLPGAVTDPTTEILDAPLPPRRPGRQEGLPLEVADRAAGVRSAPAPRQARAAAAVAAPAAAAPAPGALPPAQDGIARLFGGLQDGLDRVFGGAETQARLDAKAAGGRSYPVPPPGFGGSDGQGGIINRIADHFTPRPDAGPAPLQAPRPNGFTALPGRPDQAVPQAPQGAPQAAPQPMPAPQVPQAAPAPGGAPQAPQAAAAPVQVAQNGPMQAAPAPAQAGGLSPRAQQAALYIARFSGQPEMAAGVALAKAAYEEETKPKAQMIDRGTRRIVVHTDGSESVAYDTKDDGKEDKYTYQNVPGIGLVAQHPTDPDKSRVIMVGQKSRPMTPDEAVQYKQGYFGNDGSPHVPNAAVNIIPGETETAKAMSKVRMQPIEEAVDSAKTAKDERAALAVMSDAIATVKANGGSLPQGKYGEVVQGFKSAARTFGIDLGDVPQGEILNKMNALLASAQAKALTSRPTQFDFQVMLERSPGLSQTDEGRVALIQIFDQLAKRREELGALARHKETTPDNFDDKVKAYDEAHPILSPFTGKPMRKPEDLGMPGQAPTPSAAPAAGAPPAPADAAMRAAAAAELRRRGIIK